jgi:hypothetical protein
MKSWRRRCEAVVRISSVASAGSMKLVSVPILMPGSPLFEDLLDLADGPFLRRGNHANSGVLSRRDERMRADLPLNLVDTDVSVRPPMKGDIKVAGKDLPLRTIVQLNQVTFGMRLGFSLGRLLFKLL